MAKRFRDKRLLMIFGAFFDESGLNPHEDEALIMAGFVGHEDEWKRASEAWDQCLLESPKIDYFSRKEAIGLNGQFDRWKRPEADEKMRSLARVIAKFRLQGFAVSVPHSWFVNRHKKADKGVMGTRAYDWGFLTAVHGVLQYMSGLHADYTVDFAFDCRSELPACINVYNELKCRGDLPNMDHAGVCVPGDDKKLAALQMADMLAGESSSLVQSGAEPSEALMSIMDTRMVIPLPCTPPSLLPDTLALHAFGEEVRRAANVLCKRIYGDKEKSLKLIDDVIEVKKCEMFFLLRLERLKNLHGEGFKRYMGEEDNV